MNADTGIGGARQGFPPTRHSLLLAVKNRNAALREQAFDALVAAYWKPVYKYIRIKWSASNEDAQDLTQEFFAAAFEKSFLEPYDAGRSRFRTYLRTCVDGIVMNSRKAAARIKRGGNTETLSLDFESAERELASVPAPSALGPEEFFEREWLRNLFGMAVSDLREQCRSAGKSTHFALFEKYDLDPPVNGRPSYGELAAEFAIPLTQVTNHLSFARSQFRRHLLDQLGNITASDEEFRSEARRIFGIDVK